MSRDRKMPPGPSRRGDMLTEEEQRKLRRGQNEQASSQAEGKAEGKSSAKVGKTPGKSEGDRQTVEQELERRE
jgi:hypothetical protein